MANDSIGNLSDSQLLALAVSLYGTIQPTPTDYGLTAPFVMSLDNALSDFDDKLAKHNSSQAQAKADTSAKNISRTALESLIRDARVGAKAAKIPDNKYLEMGLPSGGPTAPNATVPAAAVDTSERLRHTINWTDAATLDNKKKPRGAMGAEIWVKIDGPPPGNENDCTFLTLDAFTPYMKEYSPADAGKTAHYMIRWRMRDGSVSAWGKTVSATITG